VAADGGLDLVVELAGVLRGDDDAAALVGGEPPEDEAGDDDGAFAGAIRRDEGELGAAGGVLAPGAELRLPVVQRLIEDAHEEAHGEGKSGAGVSNVQFLGKPRGLDVPC